MLIHINEFNPADQAQIRQDFIDNELDEVHDDIDKVQAWIAWYAEKGFTSPANLISLAIDTEKGKEEAEKNLREFLGQLFDAYWQRGEHPYGWDADELRNFLEENIDG